jgi:hypothetical protein
MALEFPDDFPFNRRQPIAVEEQALPEAAPAAAAAPALALAPAPVMTFPRVAETAAEEAPAAPVVLPAGRERRRAPRQTLVAKAAVRSESQAHLVASGFVSNISMNGVGFHTRRPLRIGEKYQLRVEVGPMRWASRLRIVACAPHGDSGTFDIGAEFVGNELETLARRELAA